MQAENSSVGKWGFLSALLVIGEEVQDRDLETTDCQC
jgi:hypothetical protein